MDRRAFLVGSLAVLMTSLGAEAQQTGRVYRIGILSQGAPPRSSAPPMFLQALRDLGYVEGRNLVVEARYAGGVPDRLPSLASELIRLNVDVIATWGAPAGLAAKAATKSIPIVLVAAGDAVGVGLVPSLPQPGGNVTGMSFLGPELVSKRLELLKEVVSKLSRVAVLWNSGNPHEVLLFGALRSAASATGMGVLAIEVRAPAEFAVAFATMVREHADGLIAFENQLNTAHRTLIVEQAARHRIPAMYGRRGFTDVGGLMAYGPYWPDVERRATAYVDKILKGARPADLPIEQPTKFELVINLKTAKALGLTIPPRYCCGRTK